MRAAKPENFKGLNATVARIKSHSRRLCGHSPTTALNRYKRPIDETDTRMRDDGDGYGDGTEKRMRGDEGAGNPIKRRAF